MRWQQGDNTVAWDNSIYGRAAWTNIKWECGWEGSMDGTVHGWDGNMDETAAQLGNKTFL